jgi:hypothetical protein
LSQSVAAVRSEAELATKLHYDKLGRKKATVLLGCCETEQVLPGGPPLTLGDGFGTADA